MVRSSARLYDNVVHVTQVYLGPAADRFVTRQIRNHLQKDPERLASRDLEELIDWIKVAMSFLTEDRVVIDEYIRDLRTLTKNRKP
jgi:hypothetical protein